MRYTSRTRATSKTSYTSCTRYIQHFGVFCSSYFGSGAIYFGRGGEDDIYVTLGGPERQIMSPCLGETKGGCQWAAELKSPGGAA